MGLSIRHLNNEYACVRFIDTASHFYLISNGYWGLGTKNKIDNPTFADEKNIPLIHQDKDYDDYNILNTSKVDEISFTEPETEETTSTLWLKQKVKRDKLAALHRYLTGIIDLIDLGRFKLTRNPKKGATIFEFYKGDKWVALTKQTGEFFAPKTLRDRFGGVNTMKNFLGIETTPPTLERSFKAVTKVKAALPTDLEMECIPIVLSWRYSC